MAPDLPQNPGRLDLRQTLSWHRMGRLDPTSRWEGPDLLKAFHTPAGPVSVRLRGGSAWESWGPGRDWLMDRRALLLSPTDPALPATSHPMLARLDLRNPGLRVVRIPWVEDMLVMTILQQRVRLVDAARAYRLLVELKPEPAPGSLGLLLPPRPHRHASLAHLGRFGVDAQRAETLLRLGLLESRLARACETGLEEVRGWLESVRGIGPWTRENVMGLAMGDPDALPTGDLHYPHIVSEMLTGRRWSSDEEMVRLLEPYRGLRFRALRLLVGGQYPST